MTEEKGRGKHGEILKIQPRRHDRMIWTTETPVTWMNMHTIRVARAAREYEVLRASCSGGGVKNVLE